MGSIEIMKDYEEKENESTREEKRREGEGEGEGIKWRPTWTKWRENGTGVIFYRYARCPVATTSESEVTFTIAF